MKKTIMFTALLAAFSTYPLTYSQAKDRTDAMANYQNYYDQGEFKIGSNMKTGEYKLIATGDDASYALSDDKGGNKLLGNFVFSDVAYVSVKDGQYLKLDRCFAVAVREIEANKPAISQIGPDDYDGMYKVGIDMGPGLYDVIPKDKKTFGYYSISEIVDGNLQVIEEGPIDLKTFITVKEGQYVVLKGLRVEALQ